MIDFLTIGTILGLSAGFAPGPLLALVISETLQHDIRAGVKVALAPMITDLPIIIITLYLSTELSNFHNILGLISLAGGLFILFVAYKSLCVKEVSLNLQEKTSKSLTKGIVVNALSPHPYLFWFSVGIPILTKAMSQNIVLPLMFVSSFYALLVGSKILLAIIVGKSKSFLRSNTYRFIMRFLGLLLCVFSLFLFWDGLKLLAFI